MLATTPNRGVVSFFLSFLLCYVIIALYLRSKCYRDPSSLFFRPESARVLTYSSFRKAQARKYADLATLHTPTKWVANSTVPELCIGIASVSRHGFSYLKETLGSVLDGLDDLERQHIYVVVFLAHTDQSQHEDFNQPWLINMADNLPTYPDDPETSDLVRQLEISGDYEAHARKQKIDYTVLLGECTSVGAKYIMTLEDDVIALDGWYHRALGALHTAARKTQELGRDSFLYLRVFYDGRLLGWNSEEWPLYVESSIAILIAEVLILVTLRWRIVMLRKTLTYSVVFLLCGVCTPMLIGLFFAAGRNCMLPKEPGVHLMHKYGCCAQGLIFPQRQVLENLLPLYRETHDNHAAVDTFLEDWANNHDSLRWAVTPVLIQHVGGKSSHGAGDQELGSLTEDMPFDYSFEMNDPIKLAREHQAWVAEMSR
ncbi:putative integral membrane protein [Daldinia childiae]|uniref:putative integral membrane protein n=1 Tax=Daldinia childiae TaxID=326645 RepID=UPI0014468122|nr:putative integral membrane protein [Daldinia childiae]KAF3054934.1 putative integral membrane protein [Daldinia childiae]